MFRKQLLVRLASLGALSLVARADVWSDFYQGLQYAATPTGGPLVSSSDGTRINGQRNGRVRIVPNQLGKGWSVQFDRGFGLDSRGRPEIFNAGPASLQLAGSVQSTLGYTARGFMIGNADTTISNLQYDLKTKTGAEDLRVQGTLNGTGSTQINQFGFYTISLDVANTNSEVSVNGVALDNTQTGDFDIGPINIQGNVFFDAFVALLKSAGADTTQLEKLMPGSPISRITDALDAATRQNKFLFAKGINDSGVGIDGESLADVVAGAQVEALSRAFGLPTTAADGSLSAVLNSSSVQAAPDSVGSNRQFVPEPSALALIGLGVLAVLARSRR